MFFFTFQDSEFVCVEFNEAKVNDVLKKLSDIQESIDRIVHRTWKLLSGSALLRPLPARLSTATELPGPVFTHWEDARLQDFDSKCAKVIKVCKCMHICSFEQMYIYIFFWMWSCSESSNLLIPAQTIQWWGSVFIWENIFKAKVAHGLTLNIIVDLYHGHKYFGAHLNLKR